MGLKATAAYRARVPKGLVFRLRRGRYAPNGISQIVCDEKGAGLVDCESDRPPVCPIPGDKVGDHILGRARRAAILEGYEHDSVAVEAIAVPTPMLGDERAFPENRRQWTVGYESHSQRSDVRTQRVIGFDC